MTRKPNKKNRPSRRFIIANHYIRVPEVRVLTEQGEMVGVMSTKEAMIKAREQDKDLILVTEKAKPPIAKIIEISKYKYQLKQKKAEGRKKAKNQEIKEVRFTPFMGEADFESRLKKVKTFITKGHKVRLSLFFKGRAIMKKDFGFEMFDKIFDKTSDIADVEIKPKMMGKKLIAQLMPAKIKIKSAPEGKKEDNKNS